MANTLKDIKKVLDTNERRQFFALVLLDVVINILDILFLAGLLWIIQLYIQPGQATRFSFLPDWITNGDSVLFIAVFVVLFSIKNILGYLVSGAHARFVSRVAVRLSYKNLFYYQQSDFTGFVNTDSSVHIRNICFRPFDFCQYMLSGIQQVITQLSLMAMTVIAILLFNAKLFLLLMLILLPPVAIVFWFVKKQLTAFKKNIQQSNERSFQYVLDALKGYVEGNIYDRNDFFLKRFINARRIFSSYLFDSLALQNLPGRIIEVFAVLGLFILIVIAKYAGNANSSMLLTIGAFMAAAYKIIPGMVKVINLTGQMKAYEFSVSDLEQTPDNKTSGSKASLGPISSIELKDVWFKYGDRVLLNNFTVQIKRGDFIGISGESGIGKTTLLNILLGFLPIEKGLILINGQPVTSEQIRHYWSQIAYVRQQGFFIHDTVLRNITLEEGNYDKRSLQAAVQAAGLDHVLKDFPEGIETIITENGKNISGGQQQRIAIARALYKDAAVLLLDEPFNELDDTAANTLLEHCKQLAATGKTILMITHDKKSLSFCTKVITLD